MKILRFAEVRETTGLSRSSVWRLEHRGKFPRRLQLSSNAVGWLEHEVLAWLEARTRRALAVSVPTEEQMV